MMKRHLLSVCLFPLAAGGVLTLAPTTAQAESWTRRVMPAGQVPGVLLDTVEVGSAPTGTSAQATVQVGPFPRHTFVIVNASGTATYSGPTTNAGIVLDVTDGTDVVADDSFEGESSSMTYRAAASHMFVLRAGQRRSVTANVAPYGAGAQTHNRNTSVRLHVVALQQP
ncbi:MAG TPA: hypothetical protein VF535_02240 [Allosphingosinicella sp.]